MPKTAHLLLVEDDDIDAKAVERALRKKKILNPLYRARDGEEALAMLRGESGAAPLPRPIVLLLDLNMPRMNGHELLEAIRQDPHLHTIVVFVLTTSSHEEDVHAAYEKHVAGYIMKSRVGDDFLELASMLESYWRVVELEEPS